MTAVDMLEAKTNLSRLVEPTERGAERETLIARNGRPVARLMAITDSPVDRRISTARDRLMVPDDIDAHSTHNAEVASLFSGTDR